MSNYVAKQPAEDDHIDFDEIENGTWTLLYDRQVEIVQGRACDQFIEGIEKLNMPRDRVPQCYEVSERLNHYTGWSVVPVPALISLKKFFTMLANRQFPAASFIRRREELDYLKEPDIFHEYFGHCPMITDPYIANFMQWYGQSALEAPKEIQTLFGRLFWFTIEFGLLSTPKGLRIFGGGILSSFEETQFAVESPDPKRIQFDVLTALSTDYRYDEIQKKYFVLEDLSVFDHIRQLDLKKIASGIINGDDQVDFITC